MAAVVFDHVNKQFGTVWAVQDLCLTVADGEFLVFVGPSGCGKTTSLRMLAGLESVTQGSLMIGDRCVNTVPPRDRDIAMVFQSYALYPHMTVYENMAFGLKMRRVARVEIDQRVHNVAKRLGMTELLPRRPKQLSGGQRQRVALGRAMVRNPAVFLMDEPLSNLDAGLRGQARSELSKLHRQLGATFIYVTHDQHEAMTLGDRIAVMRHGVLQQVADPQTLYHCPTNRFVAEFMGNPGMNIWKARVINTPEGWALQTTFAPLLLPPAWAAAVQPYADQEIDVGIRPEHWQWTPEGSLGPRWRLTVTLVEHLGHETLVYGQRDPLNPDDWILRVSNGSQLRIGQGIDVMCHPQHLHLFDPNSGQRIKTD